MFKYILIFLFGATLSLVATPVVRRIAIRWGAIDVPGARRIHSAPTARLGGLAVYFAVIVSLLFASIADSFIADTLLRHGWRLFALTAAATALMLAGVVDDRRPLRPTTKLMVEIAAAVAAVTAGCRIDSVVRIHLSWFGPLATVFWIVAVVNAVNMVDG